MNDRKHARPRSVSEATSRSSRSKSGSTSSPKSKSSTQPLKFVSISEQEILRSAVAALESKRAGIDAQIFELRMRLSSLDTPTVRDMLNQQGAKSFTDAKRKGTLQKVLGVTKHAVTASKVKKALKVKLFGKQGTGQSYSV